MTKRGQLASCKMRFARARPSSRRPSSDEARAAARVDRARTAGVTRDAICTSTPTARGDGQAVRRERQLVNQARTAGITRDAISTSKPKLNAAVKRWEAREAARVDQARTAGVTQDAISTITPGSKPSSSDEARAAARVDQAKTTGVTRDATSTSTPTARGDRQAMRQERQHELTKRGWLASRETRSSKLHNLNQS